MTILNNKRSDPKYEEYKEQLKVLTLSSLLTT
jgi:hypothetical protein